MKIGKISTRIISLLLITAMLVSGQVFSVCAEGIGTEESEGRTIVESGTLDGLEWSIYGDGCLHIDGNGELFHKYGFHVGGDSDWEYYSDIITSAVVNVTGLVDASGMFANCRELKSIDLSGFDAVNVTNMERMFMGCSNLQYIEFGNFYTRNVTDMSYMFAYCDNLENIDLNCIDTQDVTNMESMFCGCKGFDVSQLNTKNVENMKEMFADCEEMKEINLKNFNTKNVTDMAGMFKGCEQLEVLDVSNFDTKNVTDMAGMFDGCEQLEVLNVSDFHTQNVKDMRDMFNGCSQLKTLDVSNFDTRNVADMTGMFYCCSELKTLDVSNFDTRNVTSMASMFEYCHDLERVGVSGFETQNVTNMACMFSTCQSLSSIDVSNFNTQNVSAMGGMFRYCTNLQTLDVSGFETQNVESMDYMFGYCYNLKDLKINNFDTQKLTNMKGMFVSCTGLEILDLSEFNMENAENVDDMFFGCDNLKKVSMPGRIRQDAVPLLPELDGYIWRNEDNEICTEIAAGLNRPMTYTRIAEGGEPSDRLEDIKTEKTIKRNGPGYVQAKFYLCDVNKKPLKNTMFNYYYEKDGQAYVFYDKQTDEDGAFTFPTHYLNEGEACDVVFRVDLKNSKLQPYTDTYTIHASATYLSYTEEWDLSFGGGLEYGETLKGGKSKTFDRTITLKHREDGRKDLEVSLKATTENAAKLAGSLLKLKAQSENIGTSLKIVDASVSQKAKNYTMWTLAIENYDENKQEHQKMVGNFLMILIALENSNNTMLNKALSNYDLGLGSVLKSISEGCCVELGEGSSLAILDLGIGDISKVTSKLTPVDNKTVYQCSSRKDFKKNMQEHEMGISAESSLNLFSYSLLDAFGYSGFNDYGFEGFYKLDKSSFVVSQNEIKLKSEHSDEKYSGLAGDKVSRSFTFTVKDGEAAKLKEKNSKFKEIETGKGGLLNKVHMQNMADDILQCNEIQYTEADKTKIKLSGKFSSKIENLLSLDLSYSATRTTLLDVAGGEKDNGGLYCTWKSANDISGISGSYAATDLGAIVDPANRELFAELCKYVVSEIGNPVKGMVQNLGAKILQTNMSCMVTLAMIDEKTAGLFYSRNTEHTEADSRKEVALVGNAYSVYVTDEEENGINDFAEEPLILELSYNEEELVNAGLDLKDVESLHIGRYDTGSGSYENVGGELDAENQLLRVSIDKPGQYVLMSDKNAPVISNITVSDATPKPTIGMEIVDPGKISAVEMSIDDFILIDKENYMDYYNPLSNALAYKIENELAVGMHEIQIKATDSSGNISEYTKKAFAVAGMPQISGVAVPEQYQDGVDIIVIVDGYAIHCVEANVTAVKTDKTEVSEMYAMNQTSGKNEWNLHIGDKDTEKYEINFTVYDDAGHEVKSQQYLTVRKTDIPNKPNMDITVKKKLHQLTVTSAFKKTLGDQPFSLNAYSSTGGKLNYVSSNPKAAKVDDKGKVTIIGVGKTVITITAKPDENYAATSAKTTITVIPKNISGLKVKAQSGGKCKVSWKKVSKVSGYQVRYSSKSTMKSSKTVKAAGARKSCVILKKLKKGKKYYVQVRAYQKVNGTTYYGNWSKLKKVKIR